MKTLIISGLALALLTGGVMAQTAPNPAPPPARAGAAPPPPPSDGPMRDAGMDASPPSLPAGPQGHFGPPPPPPPPSKAASFRLERGDTRLGMKCADDEPMKACADIALQLLDKLATLPAMPKP